MDAQPNLSQNKLVRNTLIVLLFFGILALATTYLRNSLLTSSVSSNILALTSPVHTFFGTVERIKGSSLFIRGGYPNDFEENKKLNRVAYWVNIDQGTKIDPNLSIPYLKTFPIQFTGTLTDIKIGDYVTVETKEDLRTLKGSAFKAKSVVVFPVKNIVHGRLENISTDSISVKGKPIVTLNSPLGTEDPRDKVQTFTFRLLPQTDVSTTFDTSDGLTKKETYALIDLKEGMDVVVYSEGNVTKRTDVHALRVDPGKLK